ncbi:Asp-tRNA(Asn)/Glu-tRNA(Gln) amidotransferase subunit GatC [Campylobacter geochelonis]|uniref:Aspartyl/glutamyl-tRNA(Asn/Gln) amidotransferase subunit C n=1 Tax=Campylobacter geochelonis TaxID=1780362 RepID=A0A128EEJ8_9BACT|nr:Asp-tRNA(Asn)/Glu-tRNA(Gln) amidotransferase subunit GatC [Campylobacter geochelonis]QKF71880.1 Glu-tRNA(Gln) amidotransferase, subunit C [Campylobacter geochelonis]CZE47073.1 glutamyl-tRNA(Gln) amidotransferase%2C C subunit [Campylobacter geochelonis]CZE47350.1 glutamyl-tRNA(Gln) amidotransferase%2C C subunit [Campylobacter geochelonis]CZE50986.1 glutamyl-tRNA(Gln) amidotransferase%2C C subunit [Campylobacter geochelonis]
MAIDDNLLNKLEKLSALKIEDDKREEIKSQLDKIVNFVEILNELDLDKNKVAVSTISGGTPLREDEPNNDKEIIDIILNHAPSTDASFFVVPKIIE